MADGLASLGVKLIGTDVKAIERAENRDSFEKVMESLKLLQPKGKAVTNIEDGIKAVATPNSNLFVDPYSNESVDNAPFFYEDVTGDFVLKARVSHDFVATYDAYVLLAYDN